VVRGEPVSSASPCGAAPARIQTDAKVAQRAFKRLSAICLALPEAVCEREGRHATFRVRGKVFAYFLDNHHGDGAIAACLKGDKRENARLVAQDLKHFYSPAYVGARGYLGVRLDAGDVDWKAIVMRVRAGYRSVAPKRLMAGAQDH
jgi:phosphoribosylglycinamide formyltransferase-1